MFKKTVVPTVRFEHETRMNEEREPNHLREEMQSTPECAAITPENFELIGTFAPKGFCMWRVMACYVVTQDEF